MRPVDLEQFWNDNAIALADPFGAHIPQEADRLAEEIVPEGGAQGDEDRRHRHPEDVLPVAVEHPAAVPRAEGRMEAARAGRIHYLRAKVDRGASSPLIRTVRGLGYALGR